VVVELEAEGAGVAGDASIASAELVLGDGGVGGGGPVLGGGVAVVEDDRGELGDRVLVVGDAVLETGLVGDKGGESVVADTGSTVRVEVGGISGLADEASSDRSKSAAERVAGRDDLVARVGSLGSPDAREDGGGDLVPGRVETSVDQAARHEAGAGNLGEEQVGDPVTDRLRAAERDDNRLGGMVKSDKTANVGGRATSDVC